MIKTILRIFLLSIFIIFLLSSCWKFLSVGHPDFAYTNSTFDVPITISLTPGGGFPGGGPGDDGGRGYFGIHLPYTWIVDDSISYTGILTGAFIYSKEHSDAMATYEKPLPGYCWWIGVSDTVESLPEGNISFTPRITTDNHTGTFYIFYIISDRIENYGDYVVHSGPHPISANTAVTDIGEKTKNLSTNFALTQNYPNPFNPTTTIEFTLPDPGYVTLIVYNTLGKNVATLIDTKLNAGSHDVQFNAYTLHSGIYFYSIQVGEFNQVKKMVLLR